MGDRLSAPRAPRGGRAGPRLAPSAPAREQTARPDFFADLAYFFPRFRATRGGAACKLWILFFYHDSLWLSKFASGDFVRVAE